MEKIKFGNNIENTTYASIEEAKDHFGIKEVGIAKIIDLGSIYNNEEGKGVLRIGYITPEGRLGELEEIDINKGHITGNTSFHGNLDNLSEDLNSIYSNINKTEIENKLKDYLLPYRKTEIPAQGKIKEVVEKLLSSDKSLEIEFKNHRSPDGEEAPEGYISLLKDLDLDKNARGNLLITVDNPTQINSDDEKIELKIFGTGSYTCEYFLSVPKEKIQLSFKD